MLHVRTHREEWGEDRAEEEPGPAGGAAQAHTHIQYGAPVLHVHTQRNTAQNMQSAVMPKSAYSTLWSFDTHILICRSSLLFKDFLSEITFLG